MLGRQKPLEISPEQLDVIEAALHTQTKILHVQAEAGGSADREKLNAVKRTLAHIVQQRPAKTDASKAPRPGWFSFFCLAD
ncbi:MAG: hypothetical protein HKN30_09505 [Sulfitobacter sp.]|nr:hypothetical protein [Sulfitobacter sp.]